MSEEVKSIKDLEEFLKDVPYTATFLGVYKNEKNEKFDQQLKFSLNVNGEIFEYRMGVGHIKNTTGSNRVAELRQQGYTNVTSKVGEVQLPKEYRHTLGVVRLVKFPLISEIVYCVIMDDSGGESFKDWCDNFGYDTDSRKALKTYLECQENHDRMRDALGSRF